MNGLPEFAEEYTTVERVRIIAINLIIGCFVIFLSQLYLFPWLSVFASSAHCRTVFGFDGITVLWYGLFVGIPLSSALLISGTIGYRGYKILRDNQIPPHGEKVTRPTRIIRGSKAKIRGYFHLASCTPFLALSIWGGFQVSVISKQALIKHSGEVACQPSQPSQPPSNASHSHD